MSCAAAAEISDGLMIAQFPVEKKTTSGFWQFICNCLMAFLRLISPIVNNKLHVFVGTFKSWVCIRMDLQKNSCKYDLPSFKLSRLLHKQPIEKLADLTLSHLTLEPTLTSSNCSCERHDSELYWIIPCSNNQGNT